jgi:hypothetical protein
LKHLFVFNSSIDETVSNSDFCSSKLQSQTKNNQKVFREKENVGFGKRLSAATSRPSLWSELLSEEIFFRKM